MRNKKDQNETGGWSLWKRLLLGLGAPAAVVPVCALVYLDRLHIPCAFYRLTGLYCAGCGSGRAAAALMHGDIRAAFSWNMLLAVLGLPSAGVLVYEYLRLVFPGLRLRPVFVPQPAAAGCMVVLCAFWVLRNVPVLSFLAPGGIV